MPFSTTTTTITTTTTTYHYRATLDVDGWGDDSIKKLADEIAFVTNGVVAVPDIFNGRPFRWTSGNPHPRVYDEFMMRGSARAKVSFQASFKSK